MKIIGIILLIVGALSAALSPTILELVKVPWIVGLIVGLILAALGVVLIIMGNVVENARIKANNKKWEAEEAARKAEAARKREEAKKEAARKKKEAEEEEARKKKEAEEECARNGHIWESLPYENENFEYKPELFECLPIDGSINEKCSVCGEMRKTHLEGMRQLSIPQILTAVIVYNKQEVGTYELKLDVDGSYCMRAKKDIPSLKIARGKLFLVLQPSNFIYYSEKAIDLDPKHKEEMAETIHDNGEMPGLVEFDRYIAFVDDESGDVLSSAKIDVNWDGGDLVGSLEIGMLEIPDHGSLKAFCYIKEN